MAQCRVGRCHQPRGDGDSPTIELVIPVLSHFSRVTYSRTHCCACGEYTKIGWKSRSTASTSPPPLYSAPLAPSHSEIVSASRTRLGTQGRIGSWCTQGCRIGAYRVGESRTRQSARGCAGIASGLSSRRRRASVRSAGFMSTMSCPVVVYSE